MYRGRRYDQPAKVIRRDNQSAYSLQLQSDGPLRALGSEYPIYRVTIDAQAHEGVIVKIEAARINTHRILPVRLDAEVVLPPMMIHPFLDFLAANDIELGIADVYNESDGPW